METYEAHSKAGFRSRQSSSVLPRPSTDAPQSSADLSQRCSSHPPSIASSSCESRDKCISNSEPLNILSDVEPCDYETEQLLEQLPTDAAAAWSSSGVTGTGSGVADVVLVGSSGKMGDCGVAPGREPATTTTSLSSLFPALKDCYEQHRHLGSLLEAITGLQLAMQGVLEAMVLLDRVLYALESKFCSSVRLIKVFDAALSPRCVAMVLYK